MLVVLQSVPLSPKWLSWEGNHSPRQETRNHHKIKAWLVWGGRDLKAYPAPTSCCGQGGPPTSSGCWGPHPTWPCLRLMCLAVCQFVSPMYISSLIEAKFKSFLQFRMNQVFLFGFFWGHLNVWSVKQKTGIKSLKLIPISINLRGQFDRWDTMGKKCIY